jgi:hypothetical protein
MKSRIAQRVRAHRARIDFNRALETAGPSMRQELLAMAAGQNFNR